MTIPFNRPFCDERELNYIAEVMRSSKLCGDGQFTAKCHNWLETVIGAKRALLTASGTAALDMIALLLNLQPGDEVIMPSFTFPSTANAVVLRGAVPVFVDIRKDTQNIDESLIESAITDKTRAIMVVHYAGVACEMDKIMAIADKHNLPVVEDAAHALNATYKGRQLGTIGALSALSFHETKNIACGEGGALLINDSSLIARAEIIREKGTNRSQFYRGEIDKYTWVDIGSSYLPGELQAACLLAQLEKEPEIYKARLNIWNFYHEKMQSLEERGLLTRPVVPADCVQNGHMYYVLMSSGEERDSFIEHMGKRGIKCPFHYIPLHDSPAGKRYSKAHGDLSNTFEISERLVRFPLWVGLTEEQLVFITNAVEEFFGGQKARSDADRMAVSRNGSV